MVITKEQLDTKLGVNKRSWESEFDNPNEFLEDEIKCCLVTFVNKNEHHLASIKQLHSEREQIEEEIFSLRIKQHITFSSMKEYIEEWLEKTLAQIVQPK
jgi:hypothetical protein